MKQPQSITFGMRLFATIFWSSSARTRYSLIQSLISACLRFDPISVGTCNFPIVDKPVKNATSEFRVIAIYSYFTRPLYQSSRWETSQAVSRVLSCYFLATMRLRLNLKNIFNPRYQEAVDCEKYDQGKRIFDQVIRYVI